MGYTSMNTVIEALANEPTKKKLIETAIDKVGATLKVDSSSDVGASLETGNQTKADVLAAIMTPQEMVDAVTNNDKIDVTLEVKVKDAASVGSEVAGTVQEKLAAGEQVYYFDADLYLSRNGASPDKITEWHTPIYISFRIPESIRGSGRTFRMIHTHVSRETGKLEVSVLSNEEKANPDTTFTISLNKLSTMAFAYSAAGYVTPTYTPSYSSGSNAFTASKDSSKGYFQKIGKHSVEYISPKLSKKSKVAIVPAKIKHGKKTYKVTAISSYAFIGNDNLRMVIVGKNVKRITPDAFAGCDKLEKLKLATTKLTKQGVRNSLRGSKVNTISLLKKAQSKLASYKKIFTKKNSGAAKKLSVKKSK